MLTAYDSVHDFVCLNSPEDRSLVRLLCNRKLYHAVVSDDPILNSYCYMHFGNDANEYLSTHWIDVVFHSEGRLRKDISNHSFYVANVPTQADMPMFTAIPFYPGYWKLLNNDNVFFLCEVMSYESPDTAPKQAFLVPLTSEEIKSLRAKISINREYKTRQAMYSFLMRLYINNSF